MLRLRLEPEYVLDKMTMDELDAIVENAYMVHEDGWEQSRLVAYMTAQVNSSKHLKPTDIIEFGWEKDNQNSKHLSDMPTESDRERLQQKSKEYKKWLEQ